MEWQCYGDADGKRNGTGGTGYARVKGEDLNILFAAWEDPNGTGLSGGTNDPCDIPSDPGGNPGICADFDRSRNGTGGTGYSRVKGEDLNILFRYWEDDTRLNEPAGTHPASPDPNWCGGDLSRN